jgi:hypothetical protein
MKDHELAACRAAAVEEEWAGYQFTPDVVTSVLAWKNNAGRGTPQADEWTRTVYFKNPARPDGPSQKGYFYVRFDKNTARIAEAYGVVNDNIIGHRAFAAANSA